MHSSCNSALATHILTYSISATFHAQNDLTCDKSYYMYGYLYIDIVVAVENICDNLSVAGLGM